MKLFNFEFSTSAFAHIYIILIYFAFIYSLTNVLVSTISPDVVDLDGVNKQEKELDQNLKKDLLKSILDFKGDFEKEHDSQINPQNKAYVPRAMLEEYIKLRPSVRDVIPDDRDFYGKINIEDLDPPREDMWDASTNKFNSHDIEIDMSVDSRRHPTNIKADHIAHIGIDGEPQDVPKELEPYLQPREAQETKYISVHLRFNLSQSRVYREASAVDNLKRAKLHLSREKLPRDSGSRFQRLHVLQVTGYREEKIPNTILHVTNCINTQQNTPIEIDITSIVKTWLMNPESNHGIIIRVTNDDKSIDLDRVRRHTNASYAGSLNQVPEHIRLKRQFRGTSDDTRAWLASQPSLLIYSIDSARKHVKREHDPLEEFDLSQDHMQADDPSTTTAASVSYNRPLPVARRGPSTRNPQGGSRANQRNKSKSKPSRCSKKSLAINFDEVGWSNWIIAPHSYYANYCSGDCTWPHLDDVQNSTNHAIIQAIFNSVGRVVPKSCCAPVKLSEMSILYQLDGIVQIRRYEDMIVETCGCL